MIGPRARDRRPDTRTDVRQRPSVWWADRLWLGYSATAVPALEAIAVDPRVAPAQAANAHLQLGRWHLAGGRPDEALVRAVRSREARAPRDPPREQPTFEFDALVALERYEEAAELLGRLMATEPDDRDLMLRAVNVARSDDVGARIEAMNAVLRSDGLTPVGTADSSGAALFDRLLAPPTPLEAAGPTPLVSVIVPARDASTTLPTALRSLQAQTWRDLQIIVVDDGSHDETLDVAATFAEQDERIEVVRQPTSAGTYAARNLGLAHARGGLVTVHDADDWSHPEKIAIQAAPIAAGHARATVTSWVRADDALRLGWSTLPARRILHRNYSSLMVDRAVFDRIGVWDQVRVNADVEFLGRFTAVFGSDALVACRSDAPLSLGRRAGSSLTTATDLDHRTFVEVAGARRLYTAAYRWWHQSPGFAQEVPVPADAPRCPFPAPSLVHPESGGGHARVDVVIAGDFRERSVVRSAARLIRRCARRARTFRVLDLPAIDADVTRPLDPRIFGHLRTWGGTFLAAGEHVECGQLVVIGTGSIRALPDRLPRIDADAIVLERAGERADAAVLDLLRARLGRAGDS